MTWHADGLRRLDNVIWASIGLVTAVVVTAVVSSDFTVVLKSYVGPASACLLLTIGAWCYRNLRSDHSLASTLESTTQLLAFSATAAPLSYVAASAALPLHDAGLDHLDRALGFDWLGILATFRHYPWFFRAMHLIYFSLSLQMIAAVLLLGFTGRLLWLRAYMLAFIFAALITIAVSALLPAEGAWLYYGIEGEHTTLPLDPANWGPIFSGLRDGSFRLLMGVGSEGIITFPSLHAASAVILIGAFWPVPIARRLALVINGLMLVATPIHGSHYFVDIFAGIGVALASMTAARLLVIRLACQRTTSETAELAPAPAQARYFLYDVVTRPR